MVRMGERKSSEECGGEKGQQVGRRLLPIRCDGRAVLGGGGLPYRRRDSIWHALRCCCCCFSSSCSSTSSSSRRQLSGDSTQRANPALTQTHTHTSLASQPAISLGTLPTGRSTTTAIAAAIFSPPEHSPANELAAPAASAGRESSD